MSFAAPIAFVLTFLALPILGLYILKVRMRRVPVSTNLFWKQVYDEKPPRSLWQNFRHWLSLLMQLLLLLLLILSIAEPLLSWQQKQATHTVLVIDSSASMRAIDVVPNRFESARSRAHALIHRMREQDQMAIVLASGTPEVLIGSTSHTPTLHQVIDQMNCSDGPTHLTKAIQLGQQLISRNPQGEVVVLSDGCLDEWEWGKIQATILEATRDPLATTDASHGAPLGTSAEKKNPSQPDRVTPIKPENRATQVRWEMVGGQGNNIGITQFQGRRSFRDSIGYELWMAVHNASLHTVQCRLEVNLNGNIVDLFPLTLKPDEKWSRSIEKTSLDGGQLHAFLSHIETTAPNLAKEQLNALNTDDHAFGVLPKRKKSKVLLVTPGNLFLRKVLEANPLVELEIRSSLPESWPECDLVVLHRMVPTVLPTCDCLVVDPESDCDLWTVGDELDDPMVEEQASGSPLMANIRLDNVSVPTAKRIALLKPAVLLASTGSKEPIYASISRSEGRCLVLATNLDEGDLPFRTAFPILVDNALAWFAHEAGELTPSFATGSLVSDTYTARSFDKSSSTGAVPHLELTAPSGTRSKIALASPSAPDGIDPLESNDFRYALGPMLETGIWRVHSSAVGRPTNVENTEGILVREIAVNLANERETDLRPLEGIAKSEATRSRFLPFWMRPLWFYLAFIAAWFLALEWVLYQRRWIA